MNLKLRLISNDYIDQVTDLLLKHRLYVQCYFRFASLLEGTIAEAFEGCCCRLVNSACAWFFESLSKANPVIESAMFYYLRVDNKDQDCLKRNKLNIPPRYLKLLEKH